MKKMIGILFAVLVAALLLFALAGCKGEGDVQKVKSGEDATKAIAEVSSDVEDVSDTLQAIDKDLS
ncbi:MAG: hypothetical protein KJ955_03195 [Nanoarchaeota archaeon]|nr:hypothetical protein [Nanoarchaeota archaeon]